MSQPINPFGVTLDPGYLDPHLVSLGAAPNIMRELTAYGKQRSAVIGAENVLDFSLGNPSAPVMPEVADIIHRLSDGSHGYTPAAGDPASLEMLAHKLSKRFGGHYEANDLIFTIGATGAICLSMRALTHPGVPNEIVLPSPYFTEYTVFAEGSGCTLVPVPGLEPDFSLNLAGMEAAIGPNTRAVMINLPNNPVGNVYSKEEITALADMMRRKEKELGHPIYLISDEPYRELVFDGVEVPWLPDFYDNTLVCYSYSKSLSLPGERIGYLLINPAVTDRAALRGAILGSGRLYGYISAPGMYQRVAAECEGIPADTEEYRINRDVMYKGLTDIGYTCVKPTGTFYLWFRAPEDDGRAFSLRAMKKDLLVCPGESFCEPRYLRLALCCHLERVEKSLPVFRQLWDETGK